MVKKIFLVAFAIAVGAGTAGAMEIPKNTILLSAGFGIGSSKPKVKPYFGPTVDYDTGVILGGAVAMDWMMFTKLGITLGFEAGFNYVGYKITGFDDAGLTIMPIMFRSTWHPWFIKAKNFDLFVAAKVGLNLTSEKGKNFKDYIKNYMASESGGLAIGFTLGTAYYFTPAIGIFAEAGYQKMGFTYGSKYNPSYGDKLLLNGAKYATIGASVKLAGKAKSKAKSKS